LPTLLVRPYPVHRLAEARSALDAAARGDVAALHRLYKAAADALAAIDPDEVAEFREEHPRAARDDQALARAAVELADVWEGLVAIGAGLSDRARFRGFAWLAAQVRYELEPAPRDASRLRAYAKGAPLPKTAAEDAALFAALPALVGLGPELPDEVEGPCPVPGDPVIRLLGLAEDEDWEGIDPLDGVALTADACRAHYAAAPAAWRDVLGRGLETGLVARPAAPMSD
jgi:hypothetical protein